MSETLTRHNIYVAVIGEDGVWRPVEAVQVAGDVFEIVSVNSAPETQQWQFGTGTRVRCSEHTFMDGKTGLVASEPA